MSLQSDVLIGAQAPRLRLVPDAASTEAGEEAIELVESCGVILDPGQRLVITDALGERADGSWAASEFYDIESRQNGKGTNIEALILEGLFLSKIPLQLYTAHLFATAMEMFIRVQALLEAGGLMRYVKRISNSHGSEGVELLDGQRCLFKTRTANIARGLTVGRLYIDEAYNYSDAQSAALLPTISAAPDPQVGMFSSAGDQTVADCAVLARGRRRAIAAIEGKAKEPRLAFAEWSVPFDEKTGRLLVDPSKPESWAMANRAMGIRISPENIETEYRGMSPRKFAVERLGVGDYPQDEGGESMIAEFIWNLGLDEDSHIADRLMFGVDITPEQSSGTISSAGFYAHLDGATPDDMPELDASRVWHVETVKTQAGTAWIVPELQRMCAAHDTQVVIDARAPAATLIEALEAAEVPMIVINTAELVTASASFYRLATHMDPETKEFEPLLRHLDQRSLAEAIKSASMKKVGDGGGWKFDRLPGTGGDLTPLFAAVLALYGAMFHAEDNYDPLDSIG